MFKNVIVYRIGPGWSPSLEQLEENLGKARFAPCGASQERSAGWVEPRGEANGPLAESIGGQWILKFMVEAKVVPGSVVRRKLEERVAQIEKETGRKPGKKESRDLKEDVLLELLPMAFTKQGATPVWIDPEARLLVIGASSQGRADELVTALVEAAPGFAVSLINTNVTAVASMSEWLVSQEPPAGFSVDRECELKAADESKAVVRYARHALDIEEVREHIGQGKLPTRLAMTWDGRVSFLLTEGMQIKKIAFLEGVFDGTSGQKEDGFDADAAIATGELQKLIPDLLEALGGEVAIT
ncbi:MAG: recombination-associated protein RdgC [Pseudomonadota bacterium]